MTNSARHVLRNDYIRGCTDGSSQAGSDLRKAVPGFRGGFLHSEFPLYHEFSSTTRWCQAAYCTFAARPLRSLNLQYAVANSR